MYDNNFFFIINIACFYSNENKKLYGNSIFDIICEDYNNIYFANLYHT